MSSHYSICVGLGYMIAEEYNDALECLHGVIHQDAAALRVQCLLSLERVDLAEEEIESITSNSLKAICNGIIGLKKDQNSTKTALYSLLDLSERYQLSPLLGSLIASCHFAIGEWEQGQSTILIASEKYPNDDSIMINSVLSGLRVADFAKMKSDIALINSNNSIYAQNIQKLLEDFDETAERITSQ